MRLELGHGLDKDERPGTEIVFATTYRLAIQRIECDVYVLLSSLSPSLLVRMCFMDDRHRVSRQTVFVTVSSTSFSVACLGVKSIRAVAKDCFSLSSLAQMQGIESRTGL